MQRRAVRFLQVELLPLLNLAKEEPGQLLDAHIARGRLLLALRGKHAVTGVLCHHLGADQPFADAASQVTI